MTASDLRNCQGEFQVVKFKNLLVVRIEAILVFVLLGGSKHCDRHDQMKGDGST